MNSENYPTGKYAEKTLKLQEYLCELGYLNETDIDGWFGSTTSKALGLYMKTLEEKPLPPKPWWKSRRGLGMAKLAMGVLVSALGLFWSGAENIDASSVVDIAYNAGPAIDQLIELVKTFIEIGGALLVAFGVGQSAVGAIKAERPLDATLVATVRGKEYRVPKTIIRKKAQDKKAQDKKDEEKTAADVSRDIWLN